MTHSDALTDYVVKHDPCQGSTDLLITLQNIFHYFGRAAVWPGQGLDNITCLAISQFLFTDISNIVIRMYLGCKNCFIEISALFWRRLGGRELVEDQWLSQIRFDQTVKLVFRVMFLVILKEAGCKKELSDDDNCFNKW